MSFFTMSLGKYGEKVHLALVFLNFHVEGIHGNENLVTALWIGFLYFRSLSAPSLGCFWKQSIWSSYLQILDITYDQGTLVLCTWYDICTIEIVLCCMARFKLLNNNALENPVLWKRTLGFRYFIKIKPFKATMNSLLMNVNFLQPRKYWARFPTG